MLTMGVAMVTMIINDDDAVGVDGVCGGDFLVVGVDFDNTFYDNSLICRVCDIYVGDYYEFNINLAHACIYIFICTYVYNQ